MEVDEPEQVQDASMPAGPPEGESGKKKRFEVKKWNAVALWFVNFCLPQRADDFSSSLKIYFFSSYQGLGYCSGQLCHLS
jgi:hypothetical protein